MSDSSWETLVAAHRRVATNLAIENGPPWQVQRHAPKAAILACSDARVPPSVIFDQPAGSLFVTRIAGNTAVPAGLASLDYAVANLGVDLIVVLGHTNCGAVSAAVGGTCDGYLEPIVAPICEIARAYPDADIDHIAAMNVASTVHALVQHPGPVGQAAARGRLDIQGAIHDLRSGQLVPVGDSEPLPTPTPVEAP